MSSLKLTIIVLIANVGEREKSFICSSLTRSGCPDFSSMDITSNVISSIDEAKNGPGSAARFVMILVMILYNV